MTRTSKPNKPALGAIGMLAGAALIAAACSSGTSSADKTATAAKGAGSTPAATSAATKAAATTAATTAATKAATTTSTTPAAGGTAATGATINIGTTAIGQVLVDSKGFTLYTFKNDVAGSGKTAATALLPNWPPIMATTTAATEGPGVTGALGTATLDDGTTKIVTYKGVPLYHFKNDTAPGDTKGDKLAGIWFAALP